MILTKIAFRIIDLLKILFILLIMGAAGWEAFILNHHWEAVKMILFLMAAIIALSFYQQILLWLLSEKERRFWQSKII